MKVPTYSALTLALLCLASALPMQTSKQVSFDVEDVLKTARIEVPVHGNWCGPGHSGATSSTPCIDHFDCVCKEHDLCWTKHGDLNCKCDADMARALEGATGLAKLAREYFERSPCKAPVSIPVPKTCKRCVRIFRRRVCAPIPCGTTNKCSMLPLIGSAKMLVSRHTC